LKGATGEKVLHCHREGDINGEKVLHYQREGRNYYVIRDVVSFIGLFCKRDLYF